MGLLSNCSLNKLVGVYLMTCIKSRVLEVKVGEKTRRHCTPGGKQA